MRRRHHCAGVGSDKEATWHHRPDVNMSSAAADDAGDGDSLNNTDNAEPSRTCKIVIVGAGMAGLSAANHLLKNNISDFILLEGRNRVGGRIIAINIGKRLLTDVQLCTWCCRHLGLGRG